MTNIKMKDFVTGNLKLVASIFVAFSAMAYAATGTGIKWDSLTWAQNSNDATNGYWAYSSLDSDGDGVSDEYEQQYFNNLTSITDTSNNDSDSLTDLQEYQNLTDPTNPDTDNDGADDGVEVSKGTDPLNPEDTPRSSSILKILPLLLNQE